MYSARMKMLFGKILGFVMPRGRIIFAFAFLTPLFAQIMEKTGLTPPLGLSPLLAGAIVAGLLGTVAQVRGRWI